jgi:intein/homing endonuclease
VADSGGGAFIGGDFPGCWVGEKAADELGVEGMAGFAGFDSAEEREADEGEVAD